MLLRKIICDRASLRNNERVEFRFRLGSQILPAMNASVQLFPALSGFVGLLSATSVLYGDFAGGYDIVHGAVMTVPATDLPRHRRELPESHVSGSIHGL